MNILTKSIITLAALVATGVHAEVFPIAEDTFGTISKNTILKASGAAKSVTVSAKTKAYIGFDVGSSGIPASSVSSARLTVYVARATKTGTLYLANATGAFSETFPDKSIPMPTDAIISTTALSDTTSREFVTFDVTNQVKAWLATPSSENGFVLAADGTLALTIATKEGAGTGHPAILEVDVTPTTITGGSASFTGGVTTSSFFSTDGTNASFFVNTGFSPGAGTTTLVGGFTGKNSNGPQLRFQEDGSSNFVDIGTDGSDNFVIENKFDQAMVTLTPDGNMGIGTNSPAARLHVQNPGAQTGSIQVGGTGANGDAKFVNFGDGGIVRVGENGVDDRMELGASQFFFTGGNVGIGTTTANSALTVAGAIETLSGGVKFPDGSVQTKAAPGTGSASQFTNFGPGSFINEDSAIRVVNSTFDGVWTTSGSLLVPLRLPSGAKVLSVRAYVNDTVPGANIRVQNLTKISTGFNSVGSAVDFEVLAGASGYFNQSFTPTFDLIISNDAADFLRIQALGSGWPGNATLAVQNITVEWIMP